MKTATEKGTEMNYQVKRARINGKGPVSPVVSEHVTYEAAERASHYWTVRTGHQHIVVAKDGGFCG